MVEPNDYTDSSLSSSLVHLVKGTGKVFIGLAAGMLLAFVGRIIVARFGTEAQYGIYTLGVAIATIVGILATLGLSSGLSRTVAFAVGKGESWKVPQLISASFGFVFVASACLTVAILLSSRFVATSIFHDESLIVPLRILAFSIPFFAILNVGVAVFQGLGSMNERVYFLNVLYNAGFVAFAVIVIYLRLPFNAVFFAFLASVIVASVALLVYSYIRLRSAFNFTNARSPINSVTRELIIFSAPLLGVVLLQQIGSWIETLMIGLFKSAMDVGLYSAALPLSLLVSAPIGAAIVPYVPVIARLYAQGKMLEIQRNLVVFTRWICFVTLPIAFVFLLFPNEVMSLFFGTSYASAGDALRILSLGLFLATTAALVADTLIALGFSRYVMTATFVMFATDAALDILLIPPWGILGAAVASVTALMFGEFLYCIKLYSAHRIHPFSKNLLKPLGVVFVVFPFISLIFRNAFHVSYWMLPLFFLFFVAVFGLTLLVTRSVDKEDIELLLYLERLTGINASLAKRIIQKLVL